MQAVPELNHLAAQGFVLSHQSKGVCSSDTSEIHIKANFLKVILLVQAQLIPLGFQD